MLDTLDMDHDQGAKVRAIAKELHMSDGTVINILRKFRELMHEELVSTGVIQNENYCKQEPCSQF